jgi:hypothetical protein
MSARPGRLLLHNTVVYSPSKHVLITVNVELFYLRAPLIEMSKHTMCDELITLKYAISLPVDVPTLAGSTGHKKVTSANHKISTSSHSAFTEVTFIVITQSFKVSAIFVAHIIRIKRQ